MKTVNHLLRKRLEQFGLTGNEAEVYLALLPLGEAPIRDIIDATAIHPQLVYWAINKLQEKKLVIVSHRRHRRYVQAEDPRRLEDLEKQRLDELKQVIPDLLTLQNVIPQTIIRVDRGNEAVRSARMTVLTRLQEGQTEYVIGGGGARYYEIMGDAFPEFERKRIKLGIRKQVVAFADQKQPHTENANKFNQLAEYRYLPQSFAAPTTTTIYADTVAIYLWSDDPAVISIESKPVAESYQQYFLTLWETANE